MPTAVERFTRALKSNAPDFDVVLQPKELERLADYYKLLQKWNQRLHLVAPCSPEDFANRHVLESLYLLKHLPAGATLIDVGSGGGLPALPCLIVRSDLKATMIESSTRKAVFLREVVRRLELAGQAEVIAARFEETEAPFADFVTVRAIDRFGQMLETLIEWKPRSAALLAFAGTELKQQLEALISRVKIEKLPRSQRRFLVIAG